MLINQITNANSILLLQNVFLWPVSHWEHGHSNIRGLPRSPKGQPKVNQIKSQPVYTGTSSQSSRGHLSFFFFFFLNINFTITLLGKHHYLACMVTQYVGTTSPAK